MNTVRSKHEALADCYYYKDHVDDDGADRCPYPFKAGTPLWAAVNSSETRTLDNKAVGVVLFMVAGSDTWVWMPRDEFLRSTKKI